MLPVFWISASSVGGQCVEVKSVPGFVLIRDSKNRTNVAQIRDFAWRYFLSCIRQGVLCGLVGE
ncbi:DUF397 domain-containing protein [Streptomyces sp. NPDC019531]|uniref:DUF397 domain-containing protein n=1 Tax=Streptomyces sp. NPDC019531 TaxID=3365062 RepID=UPI00384C2272